MASSPSPSARLTLINRRALLALVVFFLALGAGVVSIWLFRTGRERDAVLRQVAVLKESSRFETALRNLDRYLKLHPDDAKVLVAQAEVYEELFKGRDNSANLEEVREAMRINDRLLRLLDSDDPDLEPSRRRLAYLYISYSDALPALRYGRYVSDLTAQESRYGAAEEIARGLVERHPEEAGDWLLLAKALDGQAILSKPEVVKEAIEAYEKSLRLDPSSKESASRLAFMYRDRYLGHDLTPEERLKQTDRSIRELGRTKAIAVLDGLLAAVPNDTDVNLIRYDFFSQSRNDAALARKELRLALEMNPSSTWVRLAAAEQAIRDGRPEEARNHIAAISLDKDKDKENTEFRAQVLRGLAEFADKSPYAALSQWRQGLVLFNGAHADLNWWMAYVQLRLGQPGDANLYINRYDRLAGKADEPGLLFLEALRHEQLGEWSEALRILETLRYNSSDPRLGQEVPLATGRCREALGDAEGALTAYREAEIFSKSSPIPKLAIASVQARRDPDRAINDLRQAYLNAPDAPEILIALLQAELLRIAAQPNSARVFAEVDEHLDQLELLDPNSPSLTLLRADRIVLDPDSKGGASELLEQAVARRPKDRSLWAAWAEALAAEGQVPKALETLDRALDPEAAGDHANLRLVRARLLVGLARGREAQAALIEGIDGLSPDQQGVLYEALGRLRMAQGDLLGARQAYTKWAEIAPGAPRPLMALIECSIRLSDEATARRLASELDRLGFKTRQLQAASPDADPITPAGKLSRAMIEVYFSDATVADIQSTSARRAIASKLAKAQQLLKDIPPPGRDRGAADPSAYALLGQLHERLAKVDPAQRDQNVALAIANYKEAWSSGIGEVLPRLVDLLARAKRIDELDQLTSAEEGSPIARRLSASALLLSGERARGNALINELAPNEPARGDAWRSRMLEMAGRFDELETELRARAEASRADELDPWFRLIQFQADRGRPTSVLNTTIEQFLKRAKTLRPEILEAQARLAARQWAAADQVYEKAATSRSQDAVTLSAVGDHFAATARPARALELYREALRLEPLARPISRQMAVLLSGLEAPGSWEEAWTLVRPEASSVEQAEDRLARAVVLARSSDPARREEAIEVLAELISDLAPRNPTAASARDYMARTLLLSDQAQRAAFYASVSAGMPTGGAPDLALHAECLLAAGQYNAAESELDRLFLLNPLDPEEARLRARLVEARSGASSPSALAEAVENRIAGPAAAALGRSAFSLLIEGLPPGKAPTAEAVDAAERIARALTDRDPGLGWMLARILVLRGKAAEALAPALAAAEAPDTLESDRILAARNALAAASVLRDDPNMRDRAIAVVDAALKYTPDSPDLLYMRAVAYHESEQYAKEVETYQRILQIWPAGRPESDRIVSVVAWLLSEFLDRPAESLPLVEDLIRRHPENSSYLFTRGVALLRLGRLDQAIADLKQACAAEETPRRTLHLARAYRAAGREEELRDQVAKLRGANLDPATLNPSERSDLQALLQP